MGTFAGEIHILPFFVTLIYLIQKIITIIIIICICDYVMVPVCFLALWDLVKVQSFKLEILVIFSCIIFPIINHTLNMILMIMISCYCNHQIYF